MELLETTRFREAGATVAEEIHAQPAPVETVGMVADLATLPPAVDAPAA